MGDNRRTKGPASAMLRNGRSTIGFLTPNILRQNHPLQWLGVVDAARERGVNVLCFLGEALHSPRGFEAQANVLYDLVNAEVVNGLVIWSGQLEWAIAHEEMGDFCRHYFPLPVVSAETAFEGIPSVLVDNYQGMREALIHLIEVHGYRRIAYIRGPANHWGAQERYRAYIETQAEYGLPLDLNLVSPPSEWIEGSAMIDLLVDERKLRPRVDFEAVVAVNDDMAFDALRALQARGVRVPGDVAVVGFDDHVHSRAITPPLTTVRPPFYEAGSKLVEMLLALMDGERVPEQVTLPAELVVRQSCGCLSPTVRQAAAEPVLAVDEKAGDVSAAQRGETLAEIVRAIKASEAVSADRLESLLDAFFDDLRGESPGAFLRRMEEALQRVAAVDGDMSVLQGALSALRRCTLPYLDGETLSLAENLWQQARTVIGETAERTQAYKALLLEQQAQTLREIGESLVTTFDIGELTNVLVGELSRLEIPSVYLSLYESPQSYVYASPVPEWSRLVLAYTEKRRIDLPSDGLRFPSHQLVPEEMWPDRLYSYVVKSLYFRERQVGFVLFEVGPRDGDVYHVLRGEISSALQGSLLRENVQERAVQLQTAAEVSQATSSILEPEVLIERVVDLVGERFGLYYVGLFLVEDVSSPDGKAGERWAVLKAGTGEAGQRMVALDHRLLVGGESMIGQCVAGKKVRIALDVGEEAVRFENPLLPSTRSELALPLISRGEAIGALTIQSVEEAAFSEEDISVMQTMADQLANAITNARLYEQAQQAYAEVEQQVRERTEELKREQEESARLQQQVIEAQQRAIQELSTPIIPVLERVIVMPLIGSIDTMRARDVTRKLLAGIRAHRAKIVILDITGVPIVDSGVAAYLNKSIQAARLKGARTIVTGVSDAVAETIVDLAIDWSEIETVADLQTGLQVALAWVGTRNS